MNQGQLLFPVGRRGDAVAHLAELHVLRRHGVDVIRADLVLEGPANVRKRGFPVLAERILQGLAILESQPRGNDRLIRLPADYAAPNVSDKILRIILSYTDYVRRTVWKDY